MKRLALIASIGLATLWPLAAHGGPGHGGHGDKPGMKHADGKPINKMCPVGREPIDPAAGTFMYKGHAIGMCCPGCEDKFMAWDEEKRDEFVTLAMSHKEPKAAHKAVAAANKTPSWYEPYTLGTCPVSGEPLGGMGDPVIKKFAGREIRFCCKKCVGKFKQNLEASMKKVDAAIIKDQMRYYPMQTCVVSGEALNEDGEESAIDMVYGNRLVRFCCKMCRSDFKKDPAKFIAKLDKAAADAQRKDYPLTTCPVSGEALGGMGEPVEVVVAGRLVRLCCKMCKPKLMGNPRAYLSKIDAAWQDNGMYLPEGGAGGAVHTDGDDHDGGMHGMDDEHHGGDDHGAHGGHHDDDDD